jgi:hypothetical protein
MSCTIAHPFGITQKDSFLSALPQMVRANRRLEVVSHGYRLEMAPDNVLVRQTYRSFCVLTYC